MAASSSQERDGQRSGAPQRLHTTEKGPPKMVVGLVREMESPATSEKSRLGQIYIHIIHIVAGGGWNQDECPENFREI